MGFRWLAPAIADYYENYDKIFANYLTSKQRPAFVQAEQIKRVAEEKKLFKKEFLTATTGKISEGNIRIGFTISRSFMLKHEVEGGKLK